MRWSICIACQYGEHNSHVEIIQEALPGMLGGMSCRCLGECVDGRYIPAQFQTTKAAVEKAFKERGNP